MSTTTSIRVGAEPGRRHRGASLRADLWLAAASLLAVSAVVIHSVLRYGADGAFSAVCLGTSSAYLVLTACAFIRPVEYLATMVLMLWTWIMVVLGVITMFAWIGLVDGDEHLLHFPLHVVFGLMQIPLIVAVYRRLDAAPHSWAADGRSRAARRHDDTGTGDHHEGDRT